MQQVEMTLDEGAVKMWGGGENVRWGFGHGLGWDQ